MINKVVKFDGSVEDFDANKLNKWAEFASGVDVDWSVISLNAYKKCFDGCTTLDLHNAMIQACVEMEDEKHLRMAGRLLIGVIYKEAFGGFSKIPKLMEMYFNMRDLEYWAHMDYTLEEMAVLEKYIDHSRDLTYNYTTLRQIKDKYLIQDRVKKRVLESPQFMFMGMAMQNMENQPRERRLDDVVKLYTYLSKLMINAPTPFLVNMRTNLKGYASCCVIKAGDNLNSLAVADHIAYMMTAKSAGIGINIGSRSKGDPVRGGQIVHQGKLPYYRTNQALVHANLQSSRGGASTISFPCLDPEVDDLLSLKNPTTVTQKRIRDIDYSILLNKLFIEKVAKNEEWLLVSILNAPKLYDMFYSSDYDGFKTEYERVLKDDSIKKTIVKARDIANKALKEGVETGRIYITFIDTMNTQTPFLDKIYSSNLCVHGDTKILTNLGYIAISDLMDKTVDVWNGQEFSKTIVRKTGIDQELMTVITDSGQELKCTPYHKFYVKDSYSSNVREVRANDLSVGDKLIKYDLPLIEGVSKLPNAYANGFYTADGTKVSESSQRVYLYGEKICLRERFDGVEFKVDDSRNMMYALYNDLYPKYFVPDASYVISSRLEWLAGYMDGDGCIYNNNDNQQLVATSTNLEFLREVQLMLQTLGVDSKIKNHVEAGMKLLPLNDGSGDFGSFMCNNAYRIIITSNGLYKLMTLGIDFGRLRVNKREPQRDAKHFIKISNIIKSGEIADTYCFNEELRHMGMFNGILTGQCQEIALPTKPYIDMVDLMDDENPEGEIGLCSLASLVLGRITDDEYEDVAYYTVLMVDNVIDLMEYPFPSLEKTAKSRRSLGIGLTNLAYELADKGLNYKTQESKKHMFKLAERHSFWLYKASLKLSKEKGVAKWMNKTKLPQGWFPHIEGNIGEITRIVGDAKLNYDWETLALEIKENGGIRNSTLIAYMPVESSSQLTNTTNGLYPIRNLKVMKTSNTNKNLLIAPDHDRLFNRYDIAWGVENKDLIDTYAIFQYFTDQAISADLYLDMTKIDTISTSSLLKDLIYMLKVGLKTRYYINSASGIIHDSFKDKSVVEEEVEAPCDACKL